MNYANSIIVINQIGVLDIEKRETILNRKTELRKMMSKKRDKLNKITKTKWDGMIFTRLVNNSFYKGANTIFTFISYKSEVDTYSIIKDAISKGKKVSVPRVISMSKGMEPILINSFEDIEIGTLGIYEPKNHCKRIEKEDIDLIITPGLAFDIRGRRIGYGGGFYDRFMIDMNSNKIAIAYSFQVLNEVPKLSDDVEVDVIITNESELAIEN